MPTEQTPEGEQILLPSVEPVSAAVRVQHLANQPYSYRKGRFAKARPMDVGLWNETARNQLALFTGGSHGALEK